MELTIFSICCIAIIFMASAVHAAKLRMAQHYYSIFLSKGKTTPKWWPSQEHLRLTSIVLNWIMTVSIVANSFLILFRQPSYVFNFIIIGMACWIVGKFVGIVITSFVIRCFAKKDGINITRECL